VVNLAEKYRCPNTVEFEIDPHNATLTGGVFKGLEVATSSSMPWESGWRFWVTGPQLAAGVSRLVAGAVLEVAARLERLDGVVGVAPVVLFDVADNLGHVPGRLVHARRPHRIDDTWL
jgi:hypothetical protein